MFGIVWIVLGVVRTFIVWFIIWIPIPCSVIVIATIISGGTINGTLWVIISVLSELCLSVARAGMCALSAMPGVDLAFLEFLVLWVTVLVIV